ncbi:hypothetical protein JOD21_000462 [Jeotgalibacillus terrae]|nr:hypothetical protein [Jeotgalibacillus terrae]
MSVRLEVYNTHFRDGVNTPLLRDRVRVKSRVLTPSPSISAIKKSLPKSGGFLQ